MPKRADIKSILIIGAGPPKSQNLLEGRVPLIGIGIELSSYKEYQRECLFHGTRWEYIRYEEKAFS